MQFYVWHHSTSTSVLTIVYRSFFCKRTLMKPVFCDSFPLSPHNLPLMLLFLLCRSNGNGQIFLIAIGGSKRMLTMGIF